MFCLKIGLFEGFYDLPPPSMTEKIDDLNPHKRDQSGREAILLSAARAGKAPGTKGDGRKLVAATWWKRPGRALGGPSPGREIIA